MISDAKLHANRANAHHSTGPRTKEGKAASSQNAVKHGLSSAKTLIRPGEEEVYAEFRQALLDQYYPCGAAEADVFAKLLHASWCLRRIRELEDALLFKFDDPFNSPDAERKMNSYARHSARFERMYRNALRDLRQLQTDRALAAQSLGEPLYLTAGVDTEKLTKQTHRAATRRRREDQDTPDPLADPLAVFDRIAADKRARENLTQNQ
jgi:hypothetical protein